MLIQGSRLIDIPVISMDSNTLLSQTVNPIINPYSLEILAYEVIGNMIGIKPCFIDINDIIRINSDGFIIHSKESLISKDKNADIEKYYDLKFGLIGMKAIDQNNHKLGKIIDFTIESNSFIIQQINIKRPLIKSLGDTELLINRKQIIEITDKIIVVSSGEYRHESKLEKVKSSYVNPFRSTSTSSD